MLLSDETSLPLAETVVEDNEMSQIVLEALNSTAYRITVPALYDVVLQRKMTRDEESADMLDIIFGNMVFDVGDFYSLADFPDYFLRITGSAAALGRDQRTSDIASFWAKKQKLVEVELKKLIKVIEQWNEMELGG